MTINTNSINSNFRLAPSIEPLVPEKASTKYTLSRVAQAALPLLIFFPSFSIAQQAIGGGKSCLNSIKGFNDSVGTEKIKSAASFTFHLTSIGLLYVNPMAVLVLQNTLGAVNNINELSANILNGKYKDALNDTFSLSGKCIYIGSIITGGPQLILISICAQGIFEAYKLKDFHSKGMYLEVFTHSIALAARTYGMSQFIEKHKPELKLSFEQLKANINEISNRYKLTSMRAQSNPLLNVIFSGAKVETHVIATQKLNGYTFHVADYYDGTRVITCLDGADKGYQCIGAYGFKNAESTDVTWHKKYFVHEYDAGKVTSYPDKQILEIY